MTHKKSEAPPIRQARRSRPASCDRSPGWFLPILSFLSLLATVNSLTAHESLLNSARNSITANELKSHIDVLSDDTFEGREAGSRGGRAAANYLMKYLKQDLEPAGRDGRYFQSFGAGYRNLLGKIEGSDPKLRNEFILIGAHYDHVGYGTPKDSYGPFGRIHNGADDNASGVSTLLEVINAFSAAQLRCKRTMIFAFWDGEEKGLLGSEHWVTHPTVPLTQIKVAINIDMVGHLRNGRVEVFGYRSMPGFRTLITEANTGSDLNLDFFWEVKQNSDHYSFFKRQIPILMYHTGLHDFYHRPSDDAHLINTDGVREVSKLVFNTLHQLGNDDRLGDFRAASESEGPSERLAFERSLPAPSPRLGVIWNAESVENGLQVTRVRAGSAASRAGIQPGDRLLELNGVPIDSTESLQQLVVRAPTASSFTVQRANQQEPLPIAVDLEGQPTRVGITWRDNPAEIGTVNLVRIVAHSPAALAGLRVRDRIHEINQIKFKNPVEFRRLISESPFPITVLIERDGQFQSVSIKNPSSEPASDGTNSPASVSLN
ncbi:MAG: M20/M25/M40 family metallo-hydrolase [Pirellulaceae bacterium]|nr:M20/M25/M40 family metallo-hydrolase [Pirellulaceae bacterium]